MLVLTVALSAPALAAEPRDSLELGATTFGPWGDERRWDKLQHSRAEVGRVQIQWKSIAAKNDPDGTRTNRTCDDGKWNWCGPDRDYDGHASVGIPAHAFLVAAPAEYAHPLCSTGLACPPAPTKEARDAWQRFFGAVVRRYGPGGSYPGPDTYHFEVWNEPNTPAYWGGLNSVQSVETRAHDYAQLVKRARWAIRNNARKALVVGPAITGGGSGPEWLEAFKKNTTAASWLDRISLHSYANSPAGVLSYIQGVRSALPDRPIWLTEWGIGSCGGQVFNVSGETAQRDFLVNSLRALPSDVQRVLWYSGEDRHETCTQPFSRMGLYRLGGSAAETLKPVGEAFRLWAG